MPSHIFPEDETDLVMTKSVEVPFTSSQGSAKGVSNVRANGQSYVENQHHPSALRVPQAEPIYDDQDDNETKPLIEVNLKAGKTVN